MTSELTMPDFVEWVGDARLLVLAPTHRSGMQWLRDQHVLQHSRYGVLSTVHGMRGYRRGDLRVVTLRFAARGERYSARRFPPVELTRELGRLLNLGLLVETDVRDIELPQVADAWGRSGAYVPLPANWGEIVRAVALRSKGRCEWIRASTGRPCGRPADGGVDHIINRAEGGPDTLENLQHLCRWHHWHKTRGEAQRGIERRVASKRRPTEDHPGAVR